MILRACEQEIALRIELDLGERTLVTCMLQSAKAETPMDVICGRALK
jgi:hypothetical protein